MCGRFTRFGSWQELYETLRAFIDLPKTPPNDYRDSYNVAPTQEVLVLLQADAGVRAVMMRWGLVPHWAREIPKGSLFNARSETVAEKPSFRTDWRRGRRCLVIANGYFEWTKDGKTKQPYRLHLPDDPMFAFAGLWTRNDTLDITSCTILTAEAVPQLRHLHPRMPVILRPEDYRAWLDAATDPAAAAALIANNLGSELAVYPVSRDVGRVSNNHPGLVEREALLL